MSLKHPASALAVLAVILSAGAVAYTAWAINSPKAAVNSAAEDAVELGPDVTVSRSAIHGIVREYLLENPEVMIEVQTALEQKQEAERVAAQQVALSERRDEIFSSEHQFEIGNPDAPITIVEFFDYNCGFCKRALADMNRFIEEDSDVRFVMKEFPVLGEPSLRAHQVSIAFSKLYPEKAGDYHRALLDAPGRKDADTALALAEQMGGDVASLRSEMEKPYVTEAIREVYQLADALGITGTPSYVVGDEVVFGAVGFASLNDKVAAIKDCGKATC